MPILAWVSGSEIVVAVLVGLLLFGGKLPEVAKDFGRVLFRLRRSVDDLRRESGIDETLRELERESRQTSLDLRLPPPPSGPPYASEGRRDGSGAPPPEPRDSAASPIPEHGTPVPRTPPDLQASENDG